MIICHLLNYDYKKQLKVITIAIQITFVLKHLQNKNKTHLHGLMLVLYIFRLHTI